MNSGSSVGSIGIENNLAMFVIGHGAMGLLLVKNRAGTQTTSHRETCLLPVRDVMSLPGKPGLAVVPLDTSMSA
jgi:hypothetical protein